MSTSTTSARCEPALPTDPPVTRDRHQAQAHAQASLPELLAAGIALAVCLGARLPHRLAEELGIREWALALVVAVVVVSVARSLARAPFTLHRRTARGHGLLRWASGEVGTLLATFFVGALVALPLYMLLRATPRWWLVAWLASAAVTVAWQLAMPLLLQTRTGPPAPASGPLAGRLRDLAAQAEVDLPAGVMVATKDSSRGANAYVVGLGPTRRVVLEQAVAAWPPELVDQAVAHELGHVRLGHAARRLPLALGAQLASLAAAAAVLSWTPVLHLAGLRSAGDPASYPLLLAAGAVVVLPARCLLAWHSRAQERAADRFALRLLERPHDFTAMLRRAADESSTPSRLPLWRRLTASHPPVDARAAASEAFLSTDFRPSGA
ncbi:MAG TPA: M48 family metalloprotease [Acidimicrobiales bacterium]|nr:M48 family metalloprotease [Acidimicrobiales bacterium]